MDLSIAYTAKLGLDYENYYAMIDETRNWNEEHGS
jgi:hypothetical protein